MKLAITTSYVNAQDAVYPLTRREAIKLLCEGGARYLDYNLDREFRHKKSTDNTPFLTDGWRDWCREVRALAESYGTTFVQTHTVFPNYYADNEADRFFTGFVGRCLEATALLGAPVTVMHPIAPPGMEYDRPGTVAVNRDYFRRQGDIAAEFGVKIAVENMLSNRLFDGTIFKRCCTTSEELMELVDAIDHPNVGACIDVGHAHYMREHVGDAIRNCADKLIALHIDDNDTFNDSHVPPYFGSLDWEAVYQALRDVHYTGGGMLECHACWKLPRELQMEAVRYLADLAEFMMAQVGGYEK